MGNTKALLIGIRYPPNLKLRELPETHQDVQQVYDFLVEVAGYDKKNIVIMRDDDWTVKEQEALVPYRENILREIDRFVTDWQPEDRGFFYFSGHGGQVKDTNGDELSSQDSAICALSYSDQKTISPISELSRPSSAPSDGGEGYFTDEKNYDDDDADDKDLIIDDDLHERLVKPIPEGCRLTALFDTCHSGTVMDLPFEYSIPSGRIRHQGVVDALEFFLQTVQEELSSLEQTVEDSFSGHEHTISAMKTVLDYAGTFTHWLSDVLHRGVSREQRSRRHERVQSAFTRLVQAVDDGWARRKVVDKETLKFDDIRCHVEKVQARRKERETSAHVISISACKDTRMAEVGELLYGKLTSPRSGKRVGIQRAGVLTHNFLEALKESLAKDICYADLIQRVREGTSKGYFEQKAQISSGNKLDIRKETVRI